eukprot:3599441-Rhodomonas_salina.1
MLEQRDQEERDRVRTGWGPGLTPGTRPNALPRGGGVQVKAGSGWRMVGPQARSLRRAASGGCEGA